MNFDKFVESLSSFEFKNLKNSIYRRDKMDNHIWASNEVFQESDIRDIKFSILNNSGSLIPAIKIVKGKRPYYSLVECKNIVEYMRDNMLNCLEKK